MSETARSSFKVPQTSPLAFSVEHRQEMISAMVRVLDSGRYILGNEVRAFEEEFACCFDFGHAVGVANGTDAVSLALRSVGVRHGDRVATSSHTAVATVAAIEMMGAVPVFVDIDPDSYTLCPASLVRTLEAVKLIRAIIVVHLYGQPADIPSIIQIAKQFGVRVIEDCAQAHGARLNGHFVGSMSDAATFSFYPTKNLGAIGDGGMVVAKDPETISKVRVLREYGWSNRYVSDLPGVNSRLDELQAAILRVKLAYLEAGNRRRQEIAAAYDLGLAQIGLDLPKRFPGAEHVYHQYVVRHPDRDQFRTRLDSKGIGTTVHYPVPAHRQPAYIGRFDSDPVGLPATDSAAGEVVSLPMYPELHDFTVQRIIEAVRTSV